MAVVYLRSAQVQEAGAQHGRVSRGKVNQPWWAVRRHHLPPSPGTPPPPTAGCGSQEDSTCHILTHYIKECEGEVSISKGKDGWKVFLWVWVWVAGGAVGQGGRFLQRPHPQLCLYRPSHATLGPHHYYFSWRASPSTYLDWVDARNWCRRRCMDLVSLEHLQEYLMVKRVMLTDRISYLWTSGRRCDFSEACHRSDLQPVDVHGWFWSGSSTRMRPTSQRAPNNDWSYSGGFGVPQPDNREGVTGGSNESCLAVLNNHYDDGVRWHDVACHHRKHWVCEDSRELLDFVRSTNPHLRL